MAQENVTRLEGGIVLTRQPWSDDYKGTADALVSAGLVQRSQLPGQPGVGKVMCTYFNGLLVGKGSHRGRMGGAACMRVQKISTKQFLVSIGVPSDERQRRFDALATERRQGNVAPLAAATATPAKPAIDLSIVGPATFEVGERCIRRRTGDQVLIIKGYQLHRVSDIDGDHVNPDGSRYSCRYGYVAQCDGQKEACFYRAAELLDLNDEERHLQIVPSRAKPQPIAAVEPPPLAPAAKETIEAMVAKTDADQLLEIVRLLSLGAKGFGRMLDRALWRGNLTEMQGELAREMAVRLGVVESVNV